MGICLDTVSHPVPEATPSYVMKNFQSTRVSGHLDVNSDHFVTVEKINMASPLIFITGGPGTGKITFSDSLVKTSKLKMFHIAMDKIITDYAKNFDAEKGATGISSQVAAQMAAARIRTAPKNHACLVSGFPRGLEDLREIEKWVTGKDGLIFLEYPLDVIKVLLKEEVKSGRMSSTQAEVGVKQYVSKCLPMIEFLSNGAPFHKIPLSGKSVEENLKLIRAIVERIVNDFMQSQPSKNAESVPVIDPAAIEPGSAKVTRPLLFVMGGPGSNKTRLCERAALRFPGWTHLGCSWLMRDLASGHSKSAEATAVHTLLHRGQLAPQRLLLQCLHRAMEKNGEADGFIISGYPRNQQQLADLQKLLKLEASVLLIDCSELELGRSLGRRSDHDDSVAACRQRLHIYRYSTLPYLRQLNTQGRLLLIDGDRDEVQIMEDLCRCLYLEIHRILGRSPLVAKKENNNMDISAAFSAQNKISDSNHEKIESAATNKTAVKTAKTGHVGSIDSSARVDSATFSVAREVLNQIQSEVVSNMVEEASAGKTQSAEGAETF